jgi:uncharacterized membrane protein
MRGLFPIVSQITRRAWFSPSNSGVQTMNEQDSPGDEPPPSGLTDQPDRRRNRLVANRAFGAIKAQHAAERSLIEGLADGLNGIASSTPFLVVHVIWFLIWVPWNLGWMGFVPFDPFPFGLLTMIVSLEAIFLSIFVLMAQKRESAIAELREELMLQVNLRMEEEVTKTLQLVAGLYTRLGHVMAEDEELGDMLRPLDVITIERELTEEIAQVAAKRKMARLRWKSSPTRETI